MQYYVILRCVNICLHLVLVNFIKEKRDLKKVSLQFVLHH